MKTYDRNRNAITIGSYVMVADSGTTGVIKNIDDNGKSEEQVRRSNCVSIEGLDGIFCPLELIRLKFN
ncbi:putative selenium delivery protein YdfZ [Plesiomonas shigelloides]|uniref:putative selenium delivery protein YdfZ n=1 Tax=Plesiomonas shigelloides TaxID=703 RepID=UPI001C5BD5E7|nr:putative selenium delivery protein YdfZ [Plesiomonas shigelloides]MBW3794684.1 putative selenium delivery protein YdfZ [Plesiomonas shigelloides]